MNPPMMITRITCKTKRFLSDLLVLEPNNNTNQTTKFTKAQQSTNGDNNIEETQTTNGAQKFEDPRAQAFAVR